MGELYNSVMEPMTRETHTYSQKSVSIGTVTCFSLTHLFGCLANPFERWAGHSQMLPVGVIILCGETVGLSG